MNVNPKHDVIIFNNDTKLNDFLVLDQEKSSNRSCKVLQCELCLHRIILKLQGFIQQIFMGGCLF
jgi:hypothetical protein